MPIDYANLVFNVKKEQAQAQISQLNNALDKTKQTSEALKFSLGSLASVFSFAALSKTAYQYSGALKQIQTNFTQVFAGAKEAKLGLERLKSEFQMTEMQAMQSLNSIAMRLRNLVPRDALAQTTTDLTALSENLAVQFAENADKIRDSLVRGLQGQTRGLRDLGINISVDSKELKDAADSLQKSAGYTEQQARSMVILNEILKQTGQSSEAFAKNSNTIKTQVDNITNTLKEQLAKIVKTLDPLLSPLLKLVNKILDSKFTTTILLIGTIGGIVKAITTSVAYIISKLSYFAKLKEAKEDQKQIVKATNDYNKALEESNAELDAQVKKIKDIEETIQRLSNESPNIFNQGAIPVFREELSKAKKDWGDMKIQAISQAANSAKQLRKMNVGLKEAQQATKAINGDASSIAYLASSSVFAFKQLFSGDWTGFLTTMTSVWRTMKIISPEANAASEVLKSSLTNLLKLFKNIGLAIKGFFTSFATLATLGFALLADVVYTGFADGWDSKKLHFTSIIQDKIADTIADIFLGVKKMKLVGDVIDTSNAMISATKKLKSSIAGFKDVVLDLNEGVNANEDWSKDFANLTAIFKNAYQTAQDAKEIGDFVKRLPVDAKKADWKGVTYTIEELKAKVQQTMDAANDWNEQLNEAAKTLNGKYREQTGRLKTLTKDLESFRMSLMTKQQKLATINAKLKELQEGPQTFASMEQQINLLEQRRTLENDVAESTRKMNETLYETLKNISNLNANYTDAIVKTSMKAYEVLNRSTAPMIDISKIQSQMQRQDSKTVNAIIDLKNAMIKVVEKSVKDFEKGIEKMHRNSQVELNVVSAF